jgi:hypothetical protein
MCTDLLRINSDDWDDAGKVYRLISYLRRNTDSTAVELELELDDGTKVQKVVPYHYIEWVAK